MKRILVLMAAAVLLAVSLAATLAEGGETAPGIAKFSTVDLNGDPFTEEYFRTNGTKLILLNLWEPWCGPCVGELPELQKLYEKYRDRGLVVLGAFSDDDVASARETVNDAGVTYPVVRSCDAFNVYTSAYVPTSAFLAPDGTVYEDQIIGSRDFSAWEQLALKYLG